MYVYIQYTLFTLKYTVYRYVTSTSLLCEKRLQKDVFSLYTSVFKKDSYSVHSARVHLFDVSFV